MYLTLAEIAILCEGKLSPNSNPNLIINQVVIDSRIITTNTLFVAILGEHQDGHNFVATSLAKGNNASLVNFNSNLNLANLIYVTDTTQALGKLAAKYRRKFTLPVVAITGSNGKTTVKEMLKNICNLEFGALQVLATYGNLNNQLGVPLTLLKLKPQHKVAIIEMGMNHKGELDYLSRLASPTIAVVNNVMWAHAGFFSGLNEIAQAKGEIYNGLLQDGIACLNLADCYGYLWQKQLKGQKVQQFDYGVIGSKCYIKHMDDNGFMLIATINGEIKTKLQVLGKHNCANALTASALALNLGCSLTSIAKGLEEYAGYKGRLEKKQAFNGALIIDDSYNANPDSVKAAILAIKALPKPHWLIFADLKELGQFSQQFHQEIGQFAASHGIEVLLTIGESAKVAYDNFSGTKLHFKNNQDIVEYCVHYLPIGATLLIKGSNSMGLSGVANQLATYSR